MSGRRMIRTKAALAAAATALLALDAGATPVDIYGALPRGVATAGTQTAASDDAGAAYYNPANLVLRGTQGTAGVTLGYSAGLPFTSIDRDPAKEARSPTRVPDWQGWATVGAQFPLGGKLRNRVALGLVLYHPQDKLVRVEALDPKYPQWLRYQSSPDRMVLAAGLGIRLHDKVAIGVAANVLAGLEGTVDFNIELFERRVERRDINFALKSAPSLIAGLTVLPVEGIRLALAYRQSNELHVSQPNTIALGDIGTLILDVDATVHYTPHELALGAQYEVSDSLKLSLDVKYHAWQYAPNPAVTVRVRLEGEIPEGLGLDEVLSFETADAPTGFTATVTPSLSAEYTFPDKTTRLRGGYAYRPTYVPNPVQPGANYLDNNAHLFGFGATFQFADPSEVFTRPLKFDLGGQAQIFQPRTADKRDGDAVGDYDYGGFALAFGAALRYEF